MIKVDRDNQADLLQGEIGNKPYDLELMLRIFILQNLYDLADMKVMNDVSTAERFLNFAVWIHQIKLRMETQ